MMERTVKGLILEETGEDVILLTRDGEFLQLPAKGYSLSSDMEVEIKVPYKRRFPFVLSAACAAAVLFITFALYLIQPALAVPEAYLALDINPSIVFSLNKNAVVIAAKPGNEDGERILESLEIEGAAVLEAMEAVMEAAKNENYLAVGRDNVIIIALAAPEGFGIDEDTLRTSVSNQLLKLQVDSYLKITITSLEKYETAEDMAIQLNALLMAEEMQDLLNSAGSHSLEGSPPLPVREFLQTVDPADIFSSDIFVTGEDRKSEEKPDNPKENIDPKGSVDDPVPPPKVEQNGPENPGGPPAP